MYTSITSDIVGVWFFVIFGHCKKQKVTTLKNGPRTLGIGSDEPSWSPISELGQISEIGPKRAELGAENPQGTPGFPLWQHFELTLFLLLSELWKLNRNVQNELLHLCASSGLVIFKTLGVIP
jgi:hypothetical protein